jgi:triosephosphate isomerase
MTDHVTQSDGDVVLMIARRLDKSDRDGLVRGYNAGMALQKQGKEFFIVTATAPSEAEPLVTGFNALFADEITLKTVIRSDPGFVLLHNGTVAAKWSYHNLPDPEEFTGDLNTLAIKSMNEHKGRLSVLAAILCLMIAVALALPYTRSTPEANNKQ